MSLFIASLNSGSNGNCYYIGNQQEAILIDDGLSCKELEIRMRRLNLDLGAVKAVFVSHEHRDHVSGLPTLLKKYRVPIYITQQTLRNGRLRFDACLINYFSAYTPVTIGNLSVTAFPKFHDAFDPHSFIITDGQVNIGVFTDIGRSCEHVVRHFGQCHAAFLESNYDEQMLHAGPYPWHLKNRITNGKGHLSNNQALELFVKSRPVHMSHLLLAHLSKENNCPNLVNELFTRHAGNVSVSVASRYNESPVFEIRPSMQASTAPIASAAVPVYSQLRLF